MVTKEQREKVKGSGKEKDKWKGYWKSRKTGESKQEVWEKKSKQSHFQNGGVKTIGFKQRGLNNLSHLVLIEHPCVTS